MPAVRGDLVLRQVGEETLILDRAGERIHQLNATASHVWSRCDGRTARSVVVRELVTQYGISSDAASRDIEVLLRQLRELGLLL